MLLKQGERIDDLQYKGLKIIQNEQGFCYGIDSILLSDFAKEIKEGSKVVDLGTGTGILGILLCGKTKLSKIIGIEIQSEVANMAVRSIQLNQLEEKFEIISENIKELIPKKLIEKNIFDVVITNPPYKKISTGKENDEEKKKISRHEITANLSDFMEVASQLLKDKGTIYMVHRPERLADIITELRKYKLEPKKIRFVYPNQEKEANMILIKAVKGAKPFLKVLKPLYIYRRDGNYTEEIKEIYHSKEKE